jgi:hypothetical protein
MGLINAALPLLLVVWGIALKYWPPLAKFPNAAIPYVNALLAFLVKVASPADAHADSTMVAGTAAAHASLWSMLLAGVIDSIKAAIMYEVFIRPPAERAGITKAVAR